MARSRVLDRFLRRSPVALGKKSGSGERGVERLCSRSAAPATTPGKRGAGSEPPFLHNFSPPRFLSRMSARCRSPPALEGGCRRAGCSRQRRCRRARGGRSPAKSTGQESYRTLNRMPRWAKRRLCRTLAARFAHWWMPLARLEPDVVAGGGRRQVAGRRLGARNPKRLFASMAAGGSSCFGEQSVEKFRLRSL
jgi:hypothetical protein